MAGFVNWVVGQVLSAGDLMKLPQHNYVRKSSDTSRQNTTSLTADPHLTLAVSANTDYRLEAYIRYTATSSSSGIWFGWTGPTSATLEWNSGIHTSYSADGTPVWDISSGDISAIGQGAGRGSGGTSNAFYLAARPLGMLRTAGTAGNITFRWAQSISYSEHTVVRTGSWLRLTRLN